MIVRKHKKPVCGIGINDADYPVAWYELNEDGVMKQKRCPYYDKWRGILKRCYDEAELKKRPKYRGCYICGEWVYFSNFKAWMEKQDWEGKHLDKDLLIYDNKEYGPNTCLFVDPRVNTLLNPATRVNKLPVGVSFNKKMRKYTAQIQDINSRVLYLGQFDDPIEASKVYYEKKIEIARLLCKESKDERVITSLIDRITRIQDEFIKEYYAST